MDLRSGTRTPKVTGLAAVGVLVLFGAWSVQAAELPSGKKPKAPAAEAKSPPNVVKPGLEGSGLTIPRATREPGINDDSEGSPCPKLPNLKAPGKRSKTCAEGETSEGDQDSDPDVEDEANEEFEDEHEGDAGQDQGPYGDGGEESTPSFDYDELTGKVPGFTPFGGEESGSSESSTVEGGRPWYEKLGKPGGGRPPADDDEE